MIYLDTCEFSSEGYKRIICKNLPYNNFKTILINETNNFNELIKFENRNHIVIINFKNLKLSFVKEILQNNFIKQFSKLLFIIEPNFYGIRELNLKFRNLSLISHSASKKELLDCLYTILKGHTYREIVFLNKDKKYDNRLQNLKYLTFKEWTVLKLIVSGKNNSLISSNLNISIRTVEKHRSNIECKLEISGRGELLLFLLKNKTIIDQLPFLFNYKI